ncbi:MAG: tRNA (guanine-N7-)-methyltransferase [Pseudomonadota bacterium]|nr:tRNA (guanine-N7-)-methyltransferase [Pseudomonadota bacterium]
MTVTRPLRTVKSFVRRQGRLTIGQEKAIENSWPVFGVDFSAEKLNLEKLFGRNAETILEIGFGNGDALLHMAQLHPEKNFIGIEVHRPGVGHLLQNIEEHDIKNIRVFCHDAIDVLKQQVPDASLNRLHLYFPDPWHKTRHHKRRIVQPDFALLVAQKLMPGGIFHLATDWKNYAEHMVKVLNTCDQFKNLSDSNDYVPRPEERLLTKFEKRGHKLGHGVWDMLYQKR